MKKIIVLLFALISFCSANAQFHDDQKRLQLKSMEDGPWKFLPAKWYYTTHPRYSGGHVPGGFFGQAIRNPKFYERRSNIKRVGPRREIEILNQQNRLNSVNSTLITQNKITNDETNRSMQAAIDIDYPIFEKYFKSAIKSYRIYIKALHYQYKIPDQIAELDLLSADINRIENSISYIHSQGLSKQINPAERHNKYLSLKTDLENLQPKLIKVGVKIDFLYKKRKNIFK